MDSIRTRSLYTTATISVTSITKPARSIASLTRRLNSRRDTPSSAMMKMWPPSRTGIGSKFRMPRFKLIIAIRPNNVTHPT